MALAPVNNGAGGNINATQNLPAGQGNGNNQQQQSQQEENDIFAGFDLDDDTKDLITGLGGEEEFDADSFEVSDDWFNKPNKDGEEEDDDENSGDDPAQTMMTEIQQQIGKLSIAHDAIPEDFDPTDRKQLAKLLNHTMQQGVMSALALMSKPTKHYVDGIASQIRDEMGKAITRGGAKSKVVEAFAPFNEQLKGPTKNLAAQNFKQALTIHKGDVKKAQLLTQKMMKALGVNVNLRQGFGGNSQNGSSQTMLEGSAALDNFFGS